MECLSEEAIVAYLRGGGAEPRSVEAHARQCPRCAFGLLLARESLAELRAKSIQPGTDRLGVVGPMRAGARGFARWIPWGAAAAGLVAALGVGILSRHDTPPPAAPPIVRTPPPYRPRKSPPPPPDASKSEPEVRPQASVPVPVPPPPPPRPEPEPLPAHPLPPAPRPIPPAAAPPLKTAEKPRVPRPQAEPPKAAPTLVETAVVARVIHSVGAAPADVGRSIRAGELLATARSEFLEVALEGYGELYFRENSQVEFGTSGDVFLHEGEMLARVDEGKSLAQVKTPAAVLEPGSRLFNVLAGKTSTEISFLVGHLMVASTSAAGPSTVLARIGKPPEVRPLEPGFASWIPEKLASKRFTGWYEAEGFPVLQGFRAMPYEQASGRQAAVQVSDQAVLAFRAGLPFRGRYAVWVRARQHEAKAAALGLRLNGQSSIDVKLDYAETKSPWRWVGPLMASGDRMDFGAQALSRWPLKEGEAARSFPVVVDVVWVTSDLKAMPPEKLSEAAGGLDFALGDPQK